MAIKQCEFLRYEMSLESEAIVRLAVMLHDTGKAITDRYGTHGAYHASYSAILAHGFIKRCLPSIPDEMTDAIVNIVRNHMRFPRNTTKIRRLVADLYPATVQEWAAACKCDMIGREPINYDVLRKIDNIVAVVTEIANIGSTDDNIVTGKFLILQGMTPGPNFKTVISAAREAQDENMFATNTGAIDWFNENYNDIIFKIEKGKHEE